MSHIGERAEDGKSGKQKCRTAKRKKKTAQAGAAKPTPRAEPAGQESQDESSPELTPAQMLGQAAKKELEKVGAQLAESLGAKAAKGDVASARLLLHLLERGKKMAEGEGCVEDGTAVAALIERWTTEPEWTGEKFGEEFLALCDEKGMHNAKKAGIYGSALLGSEAIDAIDDAG